MHTQLTQVAEAPIGGWSQGVAFSADGRTLLVLNIVERDIQVFAFHGSTLRETSRIPLAGGGWRRGDTHGRALVSIMNAPPTPSAI